MLKLVFLEIYTWNILHLHTVASKTLWPEYEMIIENESEPSTEMSEDKACTSSLVSKEKVDDTMNSLMDSFEVFIVCVAVFKFFCFLVLDS